MKKIFIVLIIMFGLTLTFKNKEVKAEEDISKPLVMVRGEYESNIVYDGYELISSNLNTNVVGTYMNTYQHYKTNEIINKTIYVVDENAVYQNDYLIEEKKNIGLFDGLTKVIKLNDESYVTIQLVDNELDERTSDVYLSLISGKEKVWEVKLFENISVSIVDLVIDNNEIYVLANFYSSYSKIDIYLKKYSLEGKYLYSYIYTGNYNDVSTKLFISGDYCYIAGNTTSTLRLFEGNRDKEDSFIIKLDKQKFEKYGDYTFGKPGIDNIESIYVIGNTTFILHSYIDYSMSNIPSIKLLKLDEELNVIKEVLVDNGYGLKTLEMLRHSSNELIITYEIYNEKDNIYKTNVIKFDLSLNKENIYTTQLNNDYHLYKVNINNDMLSILYTVSSSGYLFKMINLNDLTETVSMNYKEKKYKDIYYTDNLTILINDNNNLCESKLSIVKVINYGTNKISNNETNIFDQTIYLNGEIVSINKTKSNIQYDTTLYGKYNQNYYFEFASFDFLYNYDIYVLNNLSITNNQVYDLNIMLSFNAIGLLNDKKIDSGYVVDEVGDYTLKLIGKDNVEYDYKFKVRNLSSSIDNENNQTNVRGEVVNKIVEENSDYPTYNIDIEKAESSSNSIINWWPMLVPITLTMIGAFVIIKGVFI